MGKDWKTRCRGRRWLTVFENASKRVKRALNVKKIGQNWGKMFKNSWKHAPRAQTTCLLLFGPFPIIVDFRLSPRFANRSHRFMDAYARGLNGQQAAWAARKYKGH